VLLPTWHPALWIPAPYPALPHNKPSIFSGAANASNPTHLWLQIKVPAACVVTFTIASLLEAATHRHLPTTPTAHLMGLHFAKPTQDCSIPSASSSFPSPQCIPFLLYRNISLFHCIISPPSSRLLLTFISHRPNSSFTFEYYPVLLRAHMPLSTCLAAQTPMSTHVQERPNKACCTRLMHCSYLCDCLKMSTQLLLASPCSIHRRGSPAWNS
jgi:hypothetical protein